MAEARSGSLVERRSYLRLSAETGKLVVRNGQCDGLGRSRIGEPTFLDVDLTPDFRRHRSRGGECVVGLVAHVSVKRVGKFRQAEFARAVESFRPGKSRDRPRIHLGVDLRALSG